MSASVREKQTVALRRMLNFNAPPLKNTAVEPVWKVLIYDRFGQDIISPLLSVKELRDMGITLHLLLHSDRDPIPDVPAIYFVMPTEENIDRICQDLRNQLYELYYLNFISAISRSKLEDIASAALAANAVTQVTKVFDQYLNFITLEDDMFILCHQNKEFISYHAINRADIQDTDMEAIMDSIVDSLFCFFVTLGAVPIIRCPRGNAAEMVAMKLDKKLRENLRDARNSLFTGDSMTAGQFSFQRPLFVLADRNVDMATPLHHTWTYQALIHDVLDFHLNCVSMDEGAGVESPPTGARPKKKTRKTYDLTSADKFWQKHKGSPFPEVAESVQKELNTYRAQEDEVKRLKSIMGLEGEDEGAISMLSDNTAKLTSAVSSLPELLEKKRLIDLHTNVATAVLDHIKSRKLDVYFEYEEKLMSKSTLDKSLLDIISDPDAGTAEDKMRLFLIFYITAQQAPSESDLEQYKKVLMDTGCDLSPLNYIKQWKAFTKMAATPANYGNSGANTLGLFSRVMNTGSQFVMEGVKNLVLKQHNLPVTRILDNLMEMKSHPETDDYRYFDPKMLRGSESSIPRNKNPFQEAIVFVVGGGNYIEYQNLVDYAKVRHKKLQCCLSVLRNEIYHRTCLFQNLFLRGWFLCCTFVNVESLNVRKILESQCKTERFVDGSYFSWWFHLSVYLLFARTQRGRCMSSIYLSVLIFHFSVNFSPNRQERLFTAAVNFSTLLNSSNSSLSSDRSNVDQPSRGSLPPSPPPPPPPSDLLFPSHTAPLF